MPSPKKAAHRARVAVVEEVVEAGEASKAGVVEATTREGELRTGATRATLVATRAGAVAQVAMAAAMDMGVQETSLTPDTVPMGSSRLPAMARCVQPVAMAKQPTVLLATTVPTMAYHRFLRHQLTPPKDTIRTGGEKEAALP